ncbi:MAG: histidine triad nucleotide-binding protein [Terrimesophilobacter sp.]
MSDSGEPSIFTRIVAREIPADIVFENDTMIAFRDINPQAPVHVLVVPKTSQYGNVSELAEGNPQLLAELVATVKRLALELCGGEYRLVFNEGESVGQTVFHVHAHLLGVEPGGALAEGTLGQ